MWQILLSTLVFVVMLCTNPIEAIGNQAGASNFSSTKAKRQQEKDDVNRALVLSAQLINKRGPTMIDSDTRLDRATVGLGERFIYHHTLVNHRSQEIDPTSLRKILLPSIRDFVCSNKDMALAMKYGVTYTYAYYDMDSLKITAIDIRKDNCAP